MPKPVCRVACIFPPGVLILWALSILFGLSDEALLHAQASGGNSNLASLAVVKPLMECENLAALNVSDAVGYPTHITSASAVQDVKPAPYCKVSGYVEPAIHFQVNLPLSNWTQRYIQAGCGGLCGKFELGSSPQSDSCLPAQSGEMAMAATDMGHSGYGLDGSFGAKDYQLRIDFAYRGVHVTALAAKALIERYYGRGPKYSYFAGCSDGGREALMEAQRFPEDFNGITAGAPAMAFTAQNSFYHAWYVVANRDANGDPILTSDKIEILHKAAVDACDEKDGLKDGLISDLWGCHFDPAVIQCKPGQDQATCLTAEQLRVVREVYAGPHDKSGNKMTLSGPPVGSELMWADGAAPEPGQKEPGGGSPMALSALKYLLYKKNPPENLTFADLKFTAESFKETTELHGLYDTTDPDLSPFARRGGKLIVYHGLADDSIAPLISVAYYTAMQKVMGKAAVDEFARLYLLPGVGHCGGGDGPSQVDWLTAIMSWVEGSAAPERLLAKHTTGSGGPGGMGRPRQGAKAGQGQGQGQATGQGPGQGQGRGRMQQANSGPNSNAGGPPPDEIPRAPEKVDRTRPIYPYPYVAKYVGSGSIDDADNFVKGDAQPAPAEMLQWLGTDFFTPHYELWCTGNGAAFNCKKNN